MNQNDIKQAVNELRGLAALVPKILKTMRMVKYSEENISVVHSSFDLAISALEKQIPKPPEHKVHEKYKALGKNYYCSCGVMFVDFERNGTNFCGNCGQRLKEELE